MTTLTVLTPAQAKRLTDTRAKQTHCTGRYQRSIIGQTVHACGATVVWAERRQDKHGPYYKLYSV